MEWIKFDGSNLPPENVDIAVFMTIHGLVTSAASRGLAFFGRNIEGAFCVYNPIDDRYVDFFEVPMKEVTKWISHYCVLEYPSGAQNA